MKAYVTLLSNEAYLGGVIVLQRALKAVGSSHPLYCMLSVSVDKSIEQVLEREGIACLRLTSSAVDYNVNPDGKNMFHWNYTFDKLFVWGLTQFEKVVFLDSDLLVVKNIDHLFLKEPVSAVIADSSYPGNEHWKGLNSGLMVLVPDKHMQESMLQAISTVVKKYRSCNKPVGDQDVIQYCLKDWSKCGTLHLDEGYNLFADHLTWYRKHLGYSLTTDGEKPIYVIHFIGKSKPWQKKTLKEWIWIFRMCLKNPDYVVVYKLFRTYLRRS